MIEFWYNFDKWNNAFMDEFEEEEKWWTFDFDFHRIIYKYPGLVKYLYMPCIPIFNFVFVLYSICNTLHCVVLY